MGEGEGGWEKGMPIFYCRSGSGVVLNAGCSYRERLPLPWEIVLSHVVRGSVTLEDKQIVTRKEI